MNDESRQTLRDELEKLRANGARRQELSQHACKRLFFDFGIRPSIATVRDLTLTGSASDIPKDIDAFWARIRTASRVRIEGGAIPESLQERAGELLGQLFAEAQQHAQALLTEERAEIQHTVNASAGELRDARVRESTMEEAFKRSEIRADQASARVAALEAEIAALRGQESSANGGLQTLIRRLEDENAALAKRLDAEQATCAGLRDRIDALQSEFRQNTEHYAQQIKDAVSEAERRVKPMLVELDSLRGMAATYQAGVRDSSQKEFDFIQQLSVAKSRADRLEAQVRNQSDELDALVRECDALRSRGAISQDLGDVISSLVAEGRLSSDEIATLGTEIDPHIPVPSRCPACEEGEPELSHHNGAFELACPDCDHSSGAAPSRLAAVARFRVLERA